MSYWFSQTNFIASAEITASSASPGVVGYPLKEGSGSAVAATDGQFTGPAGSLYTVEIDSVAPGKEIGQATFRWKRADSSGWEAQCQTTSESILTLDQGVKIKWIGGSGDDFELGDKWIIETVTPFGPGGLHDLSRDTAFRSQSLDDPNWIMADLGQARQVEACFILDHNFSDSASLTLEANSADDWADPPYQQALTHNEVNLGIFLDQTYRYWRLKIQDPTNPDGLIQVGQWFLGEGLDSGLLLPSGPDTGLDGSDRDWLPRRVFSGVFVAPGEAVLDGLMEWYEELLAADQNRERPFLFCADQEEPSANTFLMKLVSQKLNHVQIGPEAFRVQLGLIEMEKSNV